jgi:cell division protein ZapB
MAMSGPSIAELEDKIDRLVEASTRLKAENEMLREREASLARERSQLLEKNERARTKIENMITRLKALAPES